jgi:hypothetical protein
LCRPLLRDGAGDQRSDLLSILRDFRLEIIDTALVGLIGDLFPGQSLRQRQQMVSRVGERPFAFPCLRVDLLLTQLE